MRLDRIVILNYAGIRALEVDLKRLTIVSGGNGQGKTSFFDAIRSVAKSGKEPDAINNDAEEAMIQLELTIDPGDSEKHEPGRYKITRKIRRDGYSNDVHIMGGKKPKAITSPGEFIKFCFPENVLDPAEFARLKAGPAAEKLRGLLTVKVTAKQLRAAAGLHQIDVQMEEYEDGISATKDIENAIREARKKVNGGIETLNGNIQTFSAGLDLSTAEDVSAQLKAARDAVGDTESKIASITTNADAARTKSIDGAKEEATTKATAVNAWYEEEVAKLQAQRLQKHDAIAEELEARKTAINAGRDKALEGVVPLQMDLGEQKALVSSLEEKQRSAAENQGKRKQLEAWEKALINEQRTAERMTLAIDGLATLQRKLMGECQIEGYDIRGGELYSDDVIWHRINHSMRTLKSVEIACMYRTANQPVILDFYESLDPKSKVEFEEAVFAGEVQIIAFEVTEGPLVIETFDEARQILA